MLEQCSILLYPLGKLKHNGREIWQKLKKKYGLI